MCAQVPMFTKDLELLIRELQTIVTHDFHVTSMTCKDSFHGIYDSLLEVLVMARTSMYCG